MNNGWLGRNEFEGFRRSDEMVAGGTAQREVVKDFPRFESSQLRHIEQDS